MADIVLNKEGFGLKLYDRFPPRYREDDIDTNYALRRYFEAVAEGGFSYAIDDWNGILKFADPDQATPQALPFLFEQFGLEVFNGIPENFLRYLLPRLGAAWSKKGGLDVIEFVASSVSGVKTTIVTHSLPNGEVDIDVRLEMDYALGDYFPDPKQLYRLLDKFLPFYLGLTIIYVYVFCEEQGIHMTEKYWLDRVKLSIPEEGCLAHSKLLPKRSLNNLDRVLNDNLYTNGFDFLPYSPDWFSDAFTDHCYDAGSIDSKWSHDYYDYSLWNRNRLNKDLYTNRRMRTDSFLDKVTTQVSEEQRVKVVDKPKDRLTTDENVRYFPALNSDLHLNDGLITNKSNVFVGEVKAIDTGTHSVSMRAAETASVCRDFSHEYYDFSKWNIHTLNHDLYTSRYMEADDLKDYPITTYSDFIGLGHSDRQIDHVSIDEKVSYLPTLNSGLCLNENFRTNEYSNVEVVLLKSADTSLDHPRTFASDNISVLVLPGLITNFAPRRTNHSTIGLPDCFDRITHKNGSIEYHFG